MNNDICKTCGKGIYVKPSHKRFNNHFCSKKCYGEWQSTQTGRLNPRRRGIERACMECGKYFHVIPCKINNSRVSKFCSKKCFDKKQTKSLTARCEICGDDFTFALSRLKHAPRFCSNKCKGLYMKGKRSHSWKGGITPQNILIRVSEKYKEWRKSVLKKDGFVCVKCGSNKNIHAHHIKRLSFILEDIRQKFPLLSISIVANSYPDLWDIKNGITLCKKCHILEHKKI